MRFIAEFNELHYRFIDRVVPDIKKAAEKDMGKIIGKSFGWENPNAHQYKLEIEAFPMDKWTEFRKAMEKEYGEKSYVFQKILELESFGKPAGDTITNPK